MKTGNRRRIRGLIQGEIVEADQIVFGFGGQPNPEAHYLAACNFDFAAASFFASFSTISPASTYSPVRLAFSSDINPRDKLGLILAAQHDLPHGVFNKAGQGLACLKQRIDRFARRGVNTNGGDDGGFHGILLLQLRRI